MDSIQVSPGSFVGPVLTWLNVNYHSTFRVIAGFFEALVNGLLSVLNMGHPIAVTLVLAAAALLVSGWRHGLLTGLGLIVCVVLGMWQATMQTLALVVVAVFFSVILGIGLGILVSRSQRLDAGVRPVLDVMQTLPPWVYLVPAVILFGLGTVPALLSTIVFGIAPMVRLTTLALKQTPVERLELAKSIGCRPIDALTKIELPTALPTLLIGVNQCILLSLAMVVLAGLVGAGGLGSEVTRGFIMSLGPFEPARPPSG